MLWDRRFYGNYILKNFNFSTHLFSLSIRKYFFHIDLFLKVEKERSKFPIFPRCFMEQSQKS